MSNEISREALLIYLDDLRALETAIYNSKEEENSINLIFKTQKEKYLAPVSNPPVEPKYQRPHYAYEDNPATVKLAFISCFATAFLLFVYVIGFSAFSANHATSAIESVLLVPGAILLGIVLVIMGIVKYISYKSLMEEEYARIALHKAALKSYEEKKASFEKSREIQEKKVVELKKKADAAWKHVDVELKELVAMRTKAYSANIIPKDFRNIHGIYYLYDYLSTSQESFSNALLHYKLEEIKAKLDNMIKLQGQAIIAQARANAVHYEQNQRILEQAMQINENTALTAQYSQIIASNTEIANKIRSKQLAYQEEALWYQVNDTISQNFR